MNLKDRTQEIFQSVCEACVFWPDPGLRAGILDNRRHPSRKQDCPIPYLRIRTQFDLQDVHSIPTHTTTPTNKHAFWRFFRHLLPQSVFKLCPVIRSPKGHNTRLILLVRLTIMDQSDVKTLWPPPVVGQSAVQKVPSIHSDPNIFSQKGGYHTVQNFAPKKLTIATNKGGIK